MRPVRVVNDVPYLGLSDAGVERRHVGMGGAVDRKTRSTAAAPITEADYSRRDALGVEGGKRLKRDHHVSLAEWRGFRVSDC